MLSIVILAAFFFILVCACLGFSKRQVLTPQFGFCLSFLISTTYAILYVEEWSLDPSPGTFWTLLGGGLLFFVVSIIVGYVYDLMHKKEKRLIRIKHKDPSTNVINIDNWKLIFFGIIQLFTLLLIIRFFSSISIGSLSATIYYYRHTNLFTEDIIRLPRHVVYLRHFSVASGYVWTYILINKFIYKSKKGRILLLVNIVISIVNGVILGGRTPAMVLIVAAGVQYYFIAQKKNGWSRVIKIKQVIKIMAICVVVLIAFEESVLLLGRTLNYDFGEYLAIYLSAEIKNLDIFIREGRFGAGPEKWQTLIYVVNALESIGISRGLYHKLDIPFQRVNGHSLGNVATTYYAFLYDGGYFAVFLFITIMAIISQIAYKKAVVSRKTEDGTISIPVIAYSYIYFTLLFSFFSNKFYEMLFTREYIRYLIFWYLLILFIKKVKLDKNKI